MTARERTADQRKREPQLQKRRSPNKNRIPTAKELEDRAARLGNMIAVMQAEQIQLYARAATIREAQMIRERGDGL